MLARAQRALEERSQEREHARVAAAPGAVRQACTKTFLVSPFLPMGLRYEFHVSAPGETLTVAIRASGPDGVVLRAALANVSPQPLSAAA